MPRYSYDYTAERWITPPPADRTEMDALYDMARGCLRPDYQRIEDAAYVRRDPVTDEISWPASRIEDDLRKIGLL